MAVLAMKPDAPRMQLTVGATRFPLPPNVTVLHIHAPYDNQLPPYVVAGTAIVGDARTDPWCSITTHDPSGEWRVSIPPRQSPALWSQATPADDRPAFVRIADRSAEWISPRDYWTITAAPGDWLLKLGTATFEISLPPIPALPKVWADGDTAAAQWQWLNVWRHRPAVSRPPQIRGPLDVHQRTIVSWVYNTIVRDILARHSTWRSDPHERYTQGSGYQYLVMYNPLASEPLHLEFLETALHIGKDHGTTNVRHTKACSVRRARKARDEFPKYQLVTFYFDVHEARCYVAEAGRVWWSRCPQYANVEFLHDISLAELEQMVLQAQTA